MHEDADLLVVDKPAGLLSVSPPGQSRPNLFDMVKAHVRRKFPARRRVWVIHRLDRDVSGLIVFARSARAWHCLKEDFRARRMHRLYLAVVEGEIRHQRESPGVSLPREPDRSGAGETSAPAGTIQSFIVAGGPGELAHSIPLGELTAARTRAGDGSEPRLAITHWRVLAAGLGRSLLQIRPHTGRKNQIRVHMRDLGHPIVGDRRYGARTDPLGRVCLHAYELGFTHPGTGQGLRFRSPAPPAFYRLVGLEPPRDDIPAKAATLAGTPPTPPSRQSVPAPGPAPVAETAWDHVADWYDALLEQGRSDHFEQVIVPGVLRLLRDESHGPIRRVLDIACGQGSLCRYLAALGLQAMGIDASPRLIARARERAAKEKLPIRFEVGDARHLESLRQTLAETPFDAAVCVMALMNMDPIEPVLQGARALLREGGVFVGVILHPAFRAPGQTAWGWEPAASDRNCPPEAADASSNPPSRRDPRTSGRRQARQAQASVPAVRQFRKVYGYLSPGQYPVTMNPGAVARGATPVVTWTFHRPLQTYVRALAQAGFVLGAVEEWPSMRVSQPGPRAEEENRARREIPMFLAFRALAWTPSPVVDRGRAPSSTSPP